MKRYVALLRAVNVGGTGKLPMADLKAMCVAAGYGRVATYIASGNVVFDSDALSARIKSDLEAKLQAYAGKPVGVLVRTASEIATVLAKNPFKEKPPTRIYAIFLDDPPPPDALDRAVGRSDEELVMGAREIYVHYPTGMGRSRLKIPAAKHGTARNMNTITRLVEMTREAS